MNHNGKNTQTDSDAPVEVQLDDIDVSETVVVDSESEKPEIAIEFEDDEIAVTQRDTEPILAPEETEIVAESVEEEQADLSQEEWRENARDELRRLSEQIDSTGEPDQTLNAANQDQVVEALNSRLDRLSPELRKMVVGRLQELLDSEWLDVQTWQGIAYVLQIAAETQIDVFKRRLTGDYEVDAWGYDPEFADYLLPVGGFFFNKYWRIELNGVENIPVEGRALMVSNHSGVLPLDGAMISYGVREHHAAHRLTRALVANWFPSIPFFSMLLNKSGQVLAHPDNGQRLLNDEELVLVFPEGYQRCRQTLQGSLQPRPFWERRICADGDADEIPDHPGFSRWCRGNIPHASQRQGHRPFDRFSLLPDHTYLAPPRTSGIRPGA